MGQGSRNVETGVNFGSGFIGARAVMLVLGAAMIACIQTQITALCVLYIAPRFNLKFMLVKVLC